MATPRLLHLSYFGNAATAGSGIRFCKISSILYGVSHCKGFAHSGFRGQASLLLVVVPRYRCAVRVLASLVLLILVVLLRPSEVSRIRRAPLLQHPLAMLLYVCGVGSLCLLRVFVCLHVFLSVSLCFCAPLYVSLHVHIWVSSRVSRVSRSSKGFLCIRGDTQTISE